LPVRELLNYLRELGGTPDEVFENEELLECFLPSIRADLELVETYQYSPFPALLRCPITALGGVDDQEADPDSLMAWREESSESFLLKMFPRGHFFIDGAQAAVAEIILGALGLERYP
jgi:medium-chain acyl-[acyl-carrier-protein] hydrolase